MRFLSADIRPNLRGAQSWTAETWVQLTLPDLPALRRLQRDAKQPWVPIEESPSGAKTGAKNRRIRPAESGSKAKISPAAPWPQRTFAHAGLALFLFAARQYYADWGHFRQLYFQGLI